jgi:hypothetical protein
MTHRIRSSRADRQVESPAPADGVGHGIGTCPLRAQDTRRHRSSDHADTPDSLGLARGSLRIAVARTPVLRFREGLPSRPPTARDRRKRPARPVHESFQVISGRWFWSTFRSGFLLNPKDIGRRAARSVDTSSHTLDERARLCAVSNALSRRLNPKTLDATRPSWPAASRSTRAGLDCDRAPRGFKRSNPAEFRGRLVTPRTKRDLFPS